MHNVIVTGASRGLGLQIAETIARRGFRAIAVARSLSDELSRAVTNIEQGSGAIGFVPFDLGDVESIPDLVRGIHRQFGPIYGLVNNAAVSSESLLATMADSDVERLIRLNTLSPILLTKYVVRRMMADGGGGRIVNVASIVATTGYNGLSVYAATKASTIGFTHSLARELGKLEICVNAVAPGFLKTAMTKELDQEGQEKIARRAALRRFASLEEVANTVAFLLGDQSTGLTGTVITVDAGSTA